MTGERPRVEEANAVADFVARYSGTGSGTTDVTAEGQTE